MLTVLLKQYVIRSINSQNIHAEPLKQTYNENGTVYTFL